MVSKTTEVTSGTSHEDTKQMMDLQTDGQTDGTTEKSKVKTVCLPLQDIWRTILMNKGWPDRDDHTLHITLV